MINIDLRTVLCRQQTGQYVQKVSRNIPQVFSSIDGQTRRWIKHETVRAWMVLSYDMLISLWGFAWNTSMKPEPANFSSFIFCQQIMYAFKQRKCLIWEQHGLPCHFCILITNMTCWSCTDTTGNVIFGLQCIVQSFRLLLLGQTCTKWGNAIKSKQGNQEPSFRDSKWPFSLKPFVCKV